ncbi:MAG: hypothetical protein LBB47_01335 [Spirochaetaceae bacterium]|nr:hypothetical protein [Spirochaetaceae bacterium]
MGSFLCRTSDELSPSIYCSLIEYADYDLPHGVSSKTWRKTARRGIIMANRD